MVLGRQAAGFLACDQREVFAVVVGAGHPAEVGVVVPHVEVEGDSLVKEPAQAAADDISGKGAASPTDVSAVPILAGHLRLVLHEKREAVKALAAVVASPWKLITGKVPGSMQRVIHPGPDSLDMK